MSSSSNNEMIKTHEIPFGINRIKAEAVDFFRGYTMTPGDWGSLTQLFFDNLSTLLGALFAVQNMKNFGAPNEDIRNCIWGKIVPGVGLTLIFGNAYYTWMAIRLTNRWGRPYTAQPYGLNTPQAFAFVFNVMYPVYFNETSLGATPGEAFHMAYKAALVANFITGLISTILACFGPWILKIVPPAALLVPIAGIGIAFLGLEQITWSIAAPIVGYMSIMFVYIGWYAGVRVGFGTYFRCPEALQVILVGAILGWITGLNTTEIVKDAAKDVKWWGPYFAFEELFTSFALCKDYLGIVIPIAISATATTLMCLVSAKQAGDPYPVRESMMVDGLGTMTSSIFGSPFGTVIYIGHPAHKRSGALVGYSLTNGLVYIVLSWFGLLSVAQSIVNSATIGPIVLFVGLMVNEEALAFMPGRHHGAYIIGLFPSIYDWAVNIGYLSPQYDQETGGNKFDVGSDNWYGVLAWKRGALLVSFVWVGMIVMVIDRRWMQATYWACIAAAFSFFGIIHVPEAGFKTFNEPVWEQCAAADDCWEFGEQWMFFVSYCMLGVVFTLIEASRRFGWDTELLPAIESKEQEAFQNWFADAAIITVPKSKHQDETHVGEHPSDPIVEEKVDLSPSSEADESDDKKEEEVTA